MLLFLPICLFSIVAICIVQSNCYGVKWISQMAYFVLTGFSNCKSCILVLTWLACFCLLQSCLLAAVLTLMNLLAKGPGQTITSLGIAHMPLTALSAKSYLCLDVKSAWIMPCFFRFDLFSATGFDFKPVFRRVL